jgi:uroporphyrin-III C-methyltransferase/precorrin-2 dehydrogenase/sirohydrochlorin ferrochelatase
VRLAGQPVLLVGDGEAADAKARLIEAAGGRIARDATPGVRLAFVALDESAAGSGPTSGYRRCRSSW